MSKLVIYVKVINEISFQYQNELLSWMKNQFPDLVYIDFDSKSDRTIVEQTKKIIQTEDFEEIYLLIASEKNSTLGIFTFLLNSLKKQGEQLSILQLDEHEQISKLLKPLSKNIVQAASLEKQKDTLSNWLN